MAYDIEKARAFAQRLKGLLRDRNLTQVEVQKETGLSQQAISGWCRGLHLPRGERLTVASYFNMSPRELCPEAFDANTPQMRTSQHKPPAARRYGRRWLLKIAPGMTVDDEFVQELMRINREFNARKKQEGFEDAW